METALYLALAVIAIALIAAILLQSRGSGLSGSVFGGDAMYGTRRGVEKTLYNVTIGLVIVFIILDLATVLLT